MLVLNVWACRRPGWQNPPTPMASDPLADHARRNFLRIAGSGLAVLALAARPDTVMAQAAGSPLKIGMVGAGREGGALGTLFAKAGHPAMFSSRHPEELKGLVAGLGPLAQAGTVEQAVAFGDVVVIGIPYGRWGRSAKRMPAPSPRRCW